MGPGLKARGVVGSRSSTDGGTWHRIKAIITQNFDFDIQKSFLFWKVTTLQCVLISYSCRLYYIIIFHGAPRSLHPRIYGSRTPRLTLIRVREENAMFYYARDIVRSPLHELRDKSVLYAHFPAGPSRSENKEV